MIAKEPGQACEEKSHILHSCGVTTGSHMKYLGGTREDEQGQFRFCCYGGSAGVKSPRGQQQEGNDGMATSVGFRGLKASAIPWPLPKPSRINESSRGKGHNQAKPKTSSSSEQSY